MRKLFLILLLPCLCGFGEYENEEQDSVIEANVAQYEAEESQVSQYEAAESPPAPQNHTSASKLEEYVNRVYKRLQVVSERPESNYFFEVLESPLLQIYYDPKKQSIVLSRGLLNKMQDEAELAATISLGIASIFGSETPERETVNILYRAGYDPKALLELQEEYFHAANAGKDHWFKVVCPVPPTASTITANRHLVSNMQQGLLRNSEEFQKEIQLKD